MKTKKRPKWYFMRDSCGKCGGTTRRFISKEQYLEGITIRCRQCNLELFHVEHDPRGAGLTRITTINGAGRMFVTGICK